MRNQNESNRVRSLPEGKGLFAVLLYRVSGPRWVDAPWEHGWHLFFMTIVCGLASTVLFFRCNTPWTMVAGVLAFVLNAVLTWCLFMIMILNGARW
jgi:hypothetical protein